MPPPGAPWGLVMVNVTEAPATGLPFPVFTAAEIGTVDRGAKGEPEPTATETVIGSIVPTVKLAFAEAEPVAEVAVAVKL